MLKNRRKNLITREGKLTLGYKSKKGYPVSVGHFVFVNPETGEESFEELNYIYGDKCKELLIKFPSENIQDFYNDSLDLYGSNNKKIRTCDGEVCNHFIPEEIDGKKYDAGETSCICESLSDGHKKKCSFNMYLKFFILNPETGKEISPLAYTFHSGSQHNIGSIYSTLESFKNGGGSFTKLPFKFFTTEMQKGQKKTYFVNLRPLITPQMVIDVYNRETKALPKGKETKAVAEGKGDLFNTEEKENKYNLPL